VDILGRAAELALDEGVRLEPAAEAQILVPLLPAQTADLNQIGDQTPSGYNRVVSDRVYLSCWVRGYNDANMLRHFARLLETFPFSRLSRRGPVLRVVAVSYGEAPVLERLFEPGAKASDLAAAAREFVQPDCAVEVEAGWDLWLPNGDWQLRPSPVRLMCFASEFDNETGDHLRIDLGLDAVFLPYGDGTSLRMHESNLRSLLTLAGDVEKALALERRQIWAESGANFADLVSKAVSRWGPH
jgi:hypothetical protein